MLNKEEIENIKVDLRILHQVLWDEHREGTDTIQRTLEYIQELEFQNTALKAEHNHNITRIKELEQKNMKR